MFLFLRKFEKSFKRKTDEASRLDTTQQQPFPSKQQRVETTEVNMWNGNSTNTSSSNVLCELDAKGEMVAHAVFLGLVLALTMLGNFLVIGTVTTNEKLRTVTNYFVVSLAVSDILVGFITLPLKVKALFVRRYKAQ